MTTASLVILVAALLVLLAVLALRRWFARHGTGRLAQLEFRRRHGERTCTLLAGSPDPRPGSPWLAVRIGGRPARMVAARLPNGRLQAGVELLDHELAVDVFHTSGDPDELQAPPDTDLQALMDIVASLRELGVDNVARPVPGAAHVMRLQFDDVEQLPTLLEAVAAELESLEALVPRDAER